MPLKNHMIEALPLHKEISCFLLDKGISFTCYNLGLKAIVVQQGSFSRYPGVLEELLEKFDLYLERETPSNYIYKAKQLFEDKQATKTYEINGLTKLNRSASSDCVCCDGCHVFSSYIVDSVTGLPIDLSETVNGILPKDKENRTVTVTITLG